MPYAEAVADSSSGSKARAKDGYNRLNDLLVRFLFQNANLIYHQITICGKELSGTGIAGNS
jgi:hypothetical protein